MRRHVAHALERGRDAQRAHDDAEVASDRLLPGEDRDRQLVERLRALVDEVVVGDDLLGQAHVRLVERTGGLVDRLGDEGRDLDESVLHLAQFLLEHLTHVSSDPFGLNPRVGHAGNRHEPARDILAVEGERQVPSC